MKKLARSVSHTMLAGLWFVIVVAYFSQTASAFTGVTVPREQAGGNYLTPIVSASVDGGATTTVAVIATANFKDAEMVSQDNGRISISFDVLNSMGVQPQVVYAVNLFQKASDGTYNMVDSQVYDDMLTIGAGQTVHKVIGYNAPEFFDGTFGIQLELRNPDGLSFDSWNLPAITLIGSGEYIAIDSGKCFFTIAGEKGDKTYTPWQGVDISPEEDLLVHCGVTNNLKKEARVTPFLETRYRSPFGKTVGEEHGGVITLTPGETRDFTVSIPKGTLPPQAYEVALSFLDEGGDRVSSLSYVHYVIRGASATILNLTADKSQYTKGDTAQLTFYAVGWADSFEGARAVTAQPDEQVLSVTLTDKDGVLCSAPSTERISTGNIFPKTSVMLITGDCVRPNVIATIVDDEGNVLAHNEYVLTPDQAGWGLDTNTAQALLLAVLVLLALGLVAYLLKRRKRVGVIGAAVIVMVMIPVAFALEMRVVNGFQLPPAPGQNYYGNYNTFNYNPAFPVNPAYGAVPPPAGSMITGMAVKNGQVYNVYTTQTTQPPCGNGISAYNTLVVWTPSAPVPLPADPKVNIPAITTNIISYTVPMQCPPGDVTSPGCRPGFLGGCLRTAGVRVIDDMIPPLDLNYTPPAEPVDRRTVPGHTYAVTKFERAYCFSAAPGSPTYYVPIGTFTEFLAFWNAIPDLPGLDQIADDITNVIPLFAGPSAYHPGNAYVVAAYGRIITFNGVTGCTIPSGGSSCTVNFYSYEISTKIYSPAYGYVNIDGFYTPVPAYYYDTRYPAETQVPGGGGAFATYEHLGLRDNSNTPTLVDKNTGQILSYNYTWRGISGSFPSGYPVEIAYPNTTFELRFNDGPALPEPSGPVLATKVITATCIGGTTWDGARCMP